MQNRPNPALSAIWIVTLVANCGRAQDYPYPALPTVPAQEPVRGWPEPSPLSNAGNQFESHDPPQNLPSVTQTSFIQPLPEPVDLGLNGVGAPERFVVRFLAESRPFDVGVDLYSPPDFEGGLIIFGPDVAMKLGGFVKADFIYDFDPIDSTCASSAGASTE